MGFIPANEHEKMGSEAFFVSGDRIFLDDTVNNRIMIYRGQNFERSIPLSPEMDVKLLFYSNKDDVLKMVYWDRFNENGSLFYLTSVLVSSDEAVPVGQKLSNNSRILLEYSFDNKGNLLTEYLSGEGAGGAFAFSDERKAQTAATQEGYCFINDEFAAVQPMTQRQIERAAGFIRGLHNPAFEDEIIMRIIYEEAKSFFQGQKTAEDVAGIIQNRVQLYLNESR